MKLLWNTKAFVYDYKIKHVACDGIAKSSNIYTHIDRNFKQHRTHMYHQYQTNNNNNIHIYVCVSQVHVRTERAEIVEIPNSVNKNDGVKNKAKYYFFSFMTYRRGKIVKIHSKMKQIPPVKTYHHLNIENHVHSAHRK